MKYQRPKGTKDILPKDIHKWQFAENTIRGVMRIFNFSEIRTPTFENTELFTRGIGSETEIVGKEMYTFLDKGGNFITLKPEMTAPVMRAYIENGLSSESPLHKLFYITSMYRYEKPQEGRYREHTQFGAEIIGSEDVNSEIELIVLAKEIYSRLGINNFKIKINSVGKPDERRLYISKLKDYLKKYINELSPDSQRRLETNPLRILDSKEKSDRDTTDKAPKIIDYLAPDSKNRFDKVINGLKKLNIKFDIDFRLVRGLDYYTDTTFEFISEKLGAQDAIGGGGRYDGLSQLLGGKPVPGVGFGSGIERVIMAAEKNNFNFPEQNNIIVYIIALNEDAKEYAVKLAYELWNNDTGCEIDLLGRSLKSQMREANKLNSKYVLIIGDEEVKKGSFILKKMEDGSQSEIGAKDVIEHLIKLK